MNLHPTSYLDRMGYTCRTTDTGTMGYNEEAGCLETGWMWCIQFTLCPVVRRDLTYLTANLVLAHKHDPTPLDLTYLPKFPHLVRVPPSHITFATSQNAPRTLYVLHHLNPLLATVMWSLLPPTTMPQLTQQSALLHRSMLLNIPENQLLFSKG